MTLHCFATLYFLFQIINKWNLFDEWNGALKPHPPPQREYFLKVVLSELLSFFRKVKLLPITLVLNNDNNTYTCIERKFHKNMYRCAEH